MSARRLTSLAVLAGFIALTGPAWGLTPPLDYLSSEGMRRGFENGATLVGNYQDRLYVERYEPGGRLRGTYAGRAYEGRWGIEGHRLCTNVGRDRPVCASLAGSPIAELRPGASFWFFVEGRPASTVHYHTRSPWEARSAQMSVRVRHNSAWGDGFTAVGSVEGLPSLFVVSTGRAMQLRYEEPLVIHGTTDGVTFTAERVTRADGTPVD
ncbi:hypothetical protein [Muricoccus radiodurans]|uniref:hypothetical protein n=1 Tax=Muricoccus radiodurans TaxID=2231721 RepID=UPI003CF277C8